MRKRMKVNRTYPVGLGRERAALQVTVAVLSLIPITAGGVGVLLGPGLVGGPPNAPDLASHFAYLSGIFMGLGILFLTTVPAIERSALVFRRAAALVVCGGLARLLTLGLVGPPSLPHRLGLVMELAVVPALTIWQARVARRCAAVAA